MPHTSDSGQTHRTAHLRGTSIIQHCSNRFALSTVHVSDPLAVASHQSEVQVLAACTQEPLSSHGFETFKVSESAASTPHHSAVAIQPRQHVRRNKLDVRTFGAGGKWAANRSRGPHDQHGDGGPTDALRLHTALHQRTMRARPDDRASARNDGTRHRSRIVWSLSAHYIATYASCRCWATVDRKNLSTSRQQRLLPQQEQDAFVWRFCGLRSLACTSNSEPGMVHCRGTDGHVLDQRA